MVMSEDGGGSTIYRGDSSSKLKLYLLKLVGQPGPYHLYECLVAARSEEEAKRVLPAGITQQEAHKYGLGPTFNWDGMIVGHATSNVVVSQVLMYRQNVVTTPPPRKVHPIKPTPPKLRVVRDYGGVSVPV